jgi:transcriptional regulator with XRE-family HTH domain
MFEIGAALRTARERQGLERADVQRELHIRESYLAALEEERFDRTPGYAYTKGFLRSYADFLGLDGQRFVDEFNERSSEDESAALPTPEPVVSHPRRPRLLVPVGALLLASVLGVLSWRLGGGARAPAHALSGTTATRAGPPAALPVAPRRRLASPQTAHVVMRARGPCWLSVHGESRAGPLLYEGTLAAGAALRYTLAPSRPRLWVRVGAPWNLRLTLNGEAAALRLTAPGSIALTRTGLESPS